MAKIDMKRLQEKAKLIVDTVKFYKQICSSYPEKMIDDIENVIGHQIYQCPESLEELWCGAVSLGAIYSKLQGKNDRITGDHIYSRKQSGRELLNMDSRKLTVRNYMKWYKEKYGVIAFVTASENAKLSQYQRETGDTNPTRTYKNAGVVPIKVSNEERKAILKGDKDTIMEVLREYHRNGPERIVNF